MVLRVAHISDIHFFHLHKTPLQFFSKRFLANFHYFFNRRKLHNSHLAYDVLPLLKKKGVSHIILTGDYTCSSSKKEFQKMQDYIKFVKNEGFEIFTLPGNHDAYTRSAHRNQSFFSYLGNLVNFKGDTPYNLAEHHVAAFKLPESPWWLVLINCSAPTPWHKSTGVFSLEVEHSLKALLNSLPSNIEIVVACHYPFELFKHPKAHLERGNHLEHILQNDKRIRIYLHGHRHIPRIEQIGSITVADSGSISLKTKSSFNLLKFTSNECELTQYQSGRPTNVQKTIRSLV